MQFMLNQFPRDSWYVSRLSCKDVPIFLEEFDERKFLFWIQIVAHVSHLGRFLRGQWDYLAECVLRLDGRLESLGLGHDRVWRGGGGSDKACFNSWSSADVSNLSAVSQLSLS
jgi:hypothetical protein